MQHRETSFFSPSSKHILKAHVSSQPIENNLHNHYHLHTRALLITKPCSSRTLMIIKLYSFKHSRLLYHILRQALITTTMCSIEYQRLLYHALQRLLIIAILCSTSIRTLRSSDISQSLLIFGTRQT